MKEVEITVKVKDRFEDAIKIIESEGFVKIRESHIKDVYLSQHIKMLKNNIENVLNKSVLLRYLKTDDREYKTITYKHKVYDKDQLIAEEKINLACKDLDKAEKLFKALGFENLITVEYDCPVYAKDGLELAFQKVKNLGLLLEVESKLDFTNANYDDIKQEKERLFKQISQLGLDIEQERDIKKAKELIKRKYNLI